MRAQFAVRVAEDFDKAGKLHLLQQLPLFCLLTQESLLDNY